MIGMLFFLIPRFVFVNVLLELIVHENLLPLQMFLFSYVGLQECILYVCV